MNKQHVKLPLSTRIKLAIKRNASILVLIALFILLAFNESIADFILS